MASVSLFRPMQSLAIISYFYWFTIIFLLRNINLAEGRPRDYDFGDATMFKNSITLSPLIEYYNQEGEIIAQEILYIHSSLISEDNIVSTISNYDSGTFILVHQNDLTLKEMKPLTSNRQRCPNNHHYIKTKQLQITHPQIHQTTQTPAILTLNYHTIYHSSSDPAVFAIASWQTNLSTDQSCQLIQHHELIRVGDDDGGEDISLEGGSYRVSDFVGEFPQIRLGAEVVQGCAYRKRDGHFIDSDIALDGGGGLIMRFGEKVVDDIGVILVLAEAGEENPDYYTTLELSAGEHDGESKEGSHHTDKRRWKYRWVYVFVGFLLGSGSCGLLYLLFKRRQSRRYEALEEESQEVPDIEIFTPPPRDQFLEEFLVDRPQRDYQYNLEQDQEWDDEQQIYIPRVHPTYRGLAQEEETNLTIDGLNNDRGYMTVPGLESDIEDTALQRANMTFSGISRNEFIEKSSKKKVYDVEGNCLNSDDETM